MCNATTACGYRAADRLAASLVRFKAARIGTQPT
jgi:hypothetical protein